MINPVCWIRINLTSHHKIAYFYDVDTHIHNLINALMIVPFAFTRL